MEQVLLFPINGASQHSYIPGTLISIPRRYFGIVASLKPS